MKKSLLVFSALIFAVVLFNKPVFGHTYWIHPADYFPAAGEEVKVFICGGHSFPKSDFAIGDKVLWQSVIYKDGNNTAFPTAIEGKVRTGAFKPGETGVYLLTFIIKRSRDKAPRFEAKTIMHIDSEPKDTAGYRLGSGLEIVPAVPLRGIKKGDSLTFEVLFDGKPVDAKCTVTPAGRKSACLNAKKVGGFSFKARHGGAYLLTASYSGRGCSLTFSLKGKTP